MTLFRYCGFDIESLIEFPELKTLETRQNEDPIAVERAPVRIDIGSGQRQGPNWVVGQKEAFWWLEGIARFRVDSKGIQVDGEPNAPEGLIRALTLEAPMTLAMQFRDAFCLAVSSTTDGRDVSAYRFLPGGGSSTAAAWQVTRKPGQLLFSDTLLHVRVDDKGQPIASPQGSGVMLWPRAIELLELDSCSRMSVRPELPLQRLELPACRDPLPLGKIITAAMYRRLQESTVDDHHTIDARRPFRLAALRTAGRLWVDAMGKTEKHFQWCLSIARHCAVERGTRSILYP